MMLPTVSLMSCFFIASFLLLSYSINGVSGDLQKREISHPDEDGSNIWFHTSNKNSQKNLANLFDDPAIPCRQTLGNDEPTGPPLFPTQCTTAWSKQIHFEGLQGFDESKQLKCCDSGCVKNLANAEFCPEHAPEAAALVENSDSRANGILVRDCKVRGFVPLNILTQLIEHTFVDDCYWTMDCVYTVICKVDNSTCQG